MLLRSISRHDKVLGTHGLTPQSVALIVKSAVARSQAKDAAELASAHSLRAGSATEAAMASLHASLNHGPNWTQIAGDVIQIHSTRA